PYSTVFRSYEWSITHGTINREFDLLLGSIAELRKGCHYIRYDVTSSFDQHLISQTNILASDKILIVKRDRRNRHPCQLGRSYLGDRGDGPDFPHLILDFLQCTGSLFCLELISDSPPGMMAGTTEGFLKIHAVHFDDHAIYFIPICLAFCFPFRTEINHFPDRFTFFDPLPGHLESQITE